MHTYPMAKTPRSANTSIRMESEIKGRLRRRFRKLSQFRTSLVTIVTSMERQKNMMTATTMADTRPLEYISVHVQWRGLGGMGNMEKKTHGMPLSMPQ